MNTHTIPAIETRRLSKHYGRARGIVDINLSVQPGQIFGFLGPNGAGKTTTIRTLLDFLHPSSGSASILGLDSHRDSLAIRKRVGNLPGELALYPNMTGQEILEYSAALRGGVPQTEITRLAGRLDADLRRPVKAYSHGNRQKIGLIQALMHRPDIVMLDEPTLGLDPLVQHEVYSLIEEVRVDGRTVFFSSHILPEVERLCDRVAIVREGRLVALETIAALKQKAVRRIDIVFAAPVGTSEFRTLPGVTEAHAAGSTIHFAVTGDLDALMKAAARHTIVNLVTYEPSLEEIFLAFYREDTAHPA